MTTLIIDIDKEEDLAAVKGFLAEKGLAYEVGEDDYEDFIYTDEMKRELDEERTGLLKRQRRSAISRRKRTKN